MYVIVCITSLSMFFLYNFRLAMFRGASSGHHLWACEDDLKSRTLDDGRPGQRSSSHSSVVKVIRANYFSNKTFLEVNSELIDTLIEGNTQ